MHCSFAMLDADEMDGLACLAGLMERLLREGVPTLLEASRRGGHLWVHMVEPTPAQVVRAWLLPYAATSGVELYPKQDWLAPGGLGSLIRLSLGVHQQSRVQVSISSSGVLVWMTTTCKRGSAWMGTKRVAIQVFADEWGHWYFLNTAGSLVSVQVGIRALLRV